MKSVEVIGGTLHEGDTFYALLHGQPYTGQCERIVTFADAGVHGQQLILSGGYLWRQGLCHLTPQGPLQEQLKQLRDELEYHDRMSDQITTRIAKISWKLRAASPESNTATVADQAVS